MDMTTRRSWRSDEPSFWCATSSDLLGVYRSGQWDVYRAALSGSTSQIIVSLHERLHHELQHTTAWGLMTEMLAGLAAEHVTPADQFARLAAYGRDASRTVHETFATIHSIGSNRRRLAWLDTNVEHRPYYDIGVRLAGGPIDANRLGVDALLRITMASPQLLRLLAAGLDGVRLRDMSAIELRPDERLRQLLFALDEVVRPEPPETTDVGSLAGYHDSVALAVRRAGIDAMTSDEIYGCFEMIIDSVDRLHPPLHARLEIDTTREPVDDDLEESQRERIVLRPGQGLTVVEIDTLDGADLINFHSTFGPHLAMLWMKASQFRDQFAWNDTTLNEDDYIIALGRPHNAEGVTAGLSAFILDGAGGPDVLARHLNKLTVITITTARSLFDAPGTATSTHVPRLYAIVDAPVLQQLEHTLGARSAVEWDSYDLHPGDELCTTVFEVAALPGIRWLHLATIAGRSYLHTWLSTQNPETVRRNERRFADSRTEIDAVASFVRSTWRQLGSL